MTFTPPFGRLTVSRTVLDALFPPACPVCRADVEQTGALCAPCWRSIKFLSGRGCSTCGREIPAAATPDEAIRCDSCTRYPPLWGRGRAVFVYEGTGRRLVLALKHGDRLDTVPMLARWLLRAGAALVEEADLVVPVPLHWTRRLARRFNQSAELARELCRVAGRPEAFQAMALRRIRRTGTQDGRGRAERATALAGAIRPARGAAQLIAGRRVLLVDDVLTTGATLNACAAACHEAGAAAVDVLVLALVPFGEEGYLPDR